MDPEIIRLLTGKTIASIEEGVVDIDYNNPGQYVIRFTDGTAVALRASYDDSEVHVTAHVDSGRPPMPPLEERIAAEKVQRGLTLDGHGKSDA